MINGRPPESQSERVTKAFEKIANELWWISLVAFFVAFILIDIGNNIRELTRVLKDNQKQNRPVSVQTCSGSQSVERGEETAK
jgi:hypothetical protein